MIIAARPSELRSRAEPHVFSTLLLVQSSSFYRFVCLFVCISAQMTILGVKGFLQFYIKILVVKGFKLGISSYVYVTTYVAFYTTPTKVKINTGIRTNWYCLSLLLSVTASDTMFSPFGYNDFKSLYLYITIIIHLNSMQMIQQLNI